jgi:Zn finger protein HypA/HybF involved in hydrogenase expression
MAHGNPRLNICIDCNQYITVDRFSKDPTCPTCEKITTQTTKEEIRKKYNLSIFHNWFFSFNNFTKI